MKFSEGKTEYFPQINAKCSEAKRDPLGEVASLPGQGKVYLTVSEIKEKRKPINLQEANFCRETFYY